MPAPYNTSADLVRTALLNDLSTQMGSAFIWNDVSLPFEYGITIYPEGDSYPYLGVVLLNRAEEILANNRRLSTIKFGIAIVSRSLLSMTDAYEQRESLADSIEPILRSYIGGHIGVFEISTCTIKNVSYWDSVLELGKVSNTPPWDSSAGIEIDVLMIIPY